MNEYDAMEIEKLDYEPTDEELKAFNEWLDSFKNIDIALLAIHSR